MWTVIIVVVIVIVLMKRADRGPDDTKKPEIQREVPKKTELTILNTDGTKISLEPMCGAMSQRMFGIEFAGCMFDLEGICKIYLQDPIGLNEDFVDATTVYFNEEIIDIRSEGENMLCLTIGTDEKLSYNGSKYVSKTAQVYLRPELAEIYKHKLKIGDRVGVLGILISAEQWGFELGHGALIIDINGVVDVTNARLGI